MLCALLALLALVVAACGPEAPDSPGDAPSRSADARPAAPTDAAGRLLPPAEPGAPGRGRDARGAIETRAVLDGHAAVTVVDHAGLPVEGVQVVGFDVDEEGNPQRSIRFTFAEETGPDGRAFLRPRRQGDLYAAALFDEQPAASTDADPLRIQLPPCGSLLVEVAAFIEQPRLRVGRASDGDRVTVRSTVGGELSVGRIPLGEQLEVSLVHAGGMITETIDGPGTAGEVVAWRPEPPPSVVLRARLVDADGDPLDGISATFWRRRGSIVLSPVDGEAGHVKGRVPEEDWDLELGDVAIVRERDGERLDAGLLDGEVEVPVLPASRVVELGDVVLTERPFVTSGRVVTTDRRPAENARVRLVFRSDAEVTRDVEYEAGLSVLGAAFGTSGLLKDGRQRAAFASVDFTDERGRFELRSSRPLSPADTARLAVEAKDLGGRLGTRLDPVRPGRKDIEIVLAVDGDVQADMSMIPPSIRESVALELTPLSGLGGLETYRIRTQRSNPVVASVAAGRYRAAVTVELYRSVIWRQPMSVIDVNSGELVHPAELSPLALPLASATVLCPGGEALSEHQVSVRWPPSSPGVRSANLAHVDRVGGNVTWLDVARPSHLLLVVQGFAPVDLRQLTDGDVVTLVAEAPVRLVFEGAPRPTREGRFRVTPHGRDGGLFDSSLSQELGRDADGSIHVSIAPGVTYLLDTPYVEGGTLLGLGERTTVEYDMPESDEGWDGIEFQVPLGATEVVLRPR